jgi:hypothetical protein
MIIVLSFASLRGMQGERNKKNVRASVVDFVLEGR